MSNGDIQRIRDKLKNFWDNLPKESDLYDKSYGIVPPMGDLKKCKILNDLDKIFHELELNNEWEVIDSIFVILEDKINNNNWVDLAQFVQRYHNNKLNHAMAIINNAMEQKVDSIFDMSKKDERLDSLLVFTSPAGLTLSQAQDINKKYADKVIENASNKERRIDEAQIEALKQRGLHNEDLRYEKAKKEQGMTIPLSSNGIGEINYLDLENTCIEGYRLVRLSVDGIFEIYKWDELTKRYIKIDTNKTLATDINSYAYQLYGNDIEITQSKIDTMVNRMRHSTVPLLDNSSFTSESNEKQLFFLNGYYDFRDSQFHKEDTSQWFHTFTIPCNYYENASNPMIFDEMLNRIFDSNKIKITLTYQIIGAIISNVTLKNIFVFQGKSHGGKSTIAECIVRLLNEDEVKFIGSMNELDESKAKTFERRVKLLNIDDAPSDKWSSSTISYLKTRSRGVSQKNKLTFKILLNTNYEIGFKTENGRDESIENRIIILPFDKDMKAASDNEYMNDTDKAMTELIKNYLESRFDEEKMGIIKKAILAFQKVLTNDNEFVYKFPLNKSVSSPKFLVSLKTKEQKEQRTRDFLSSKFEITNNETEYMKAEDIMAYLNNEKSEEILKFDRPHEVGKFLKNIWSEQIVQKRYDDKTYYNLKLKP